SGHLRRNLSVHVAITTCAKAGRRLEVRADGQLCSCRHQCPARPRGLGSKRCPLGDASRPLAMHIADALGAEFHVHETPEEGTCEHDRKGHGQEDEKTAHASPTRQITHSWLTTGETRNHLFTVSVATVFAAHITVTLVAAVLPGIAALTSHQPSGRA